MKKFVLCALMLVTSAVTSQPMNTTDPVTGNLVYTTVNPAPPGADPHSWSGFITTTSNGGGYSGGNVPAYNPNTGTFMFGYTQRTVAYTTAVNQALAIAGTGIQVRGLRYSWEYFNQDMSRGTLTGNISLTDTGGQTLQNYSYNMPQTTTGWTRMTGTENFNTQYSPSMIGNLNVSFTGKDNRFWAGYYGPQIRDIGVSLLYSVATPPIPTDFLRWIKLTDENGTFTLNSPGVVRYGANGAYAYRSLEPGTYECSNGAWGRDPIGGVYKSCEVGSNTAATTTVPTVPKNTQTAANTTVVPADPVAVQDPVTTTPTSSTTSTAAATTTTTDPVATTAVAGPATNQAAGASPAPTAATATASTSTASSSASSSTAAASTSTSRESAQSGGGNVGLALSVISRNQDRDTANAAIAQAAVSQAQAAADQSQQEAASVAAQATANSTGSSAAASAGAQSAGGPGIRIGAAQSQAAQSGSAPVASLITNPTGVAVLNSGLSTQQSRSVSVQTETASVLPNNPLLDRSNPLNEFFEPRVTVPQSSSNISTGPTVNRNVGDNEAAGGVDINRMALAPQGYGDYLNFVLRDAAFYAPREVYRNQRTVDNARALRQLTNDSRHRDMVEQQYRR